jgi:hypothetical protein
MTDENFPAEGIATGFDNVDEEPPYNREEDADSGPMARDLSPEEQKKVFASIMVNSGVLMVPENFDNKRNLVLREITEALKVKSTEMNPLDPEFKKTEYKFWMLYEVTTIGECKLDKLKETILDKEKFIPEIKKPEIDEAVFQEVALEVAEMILQ